jgi:hypothetical protein
VLTDLSVLFVARQLAGAKIAGPLASSKHVYVNTLMIQQVLAEPEWQNRFTEIGPIVPEEATRQSVETFTLNIQDRLPPEQAAQFPCATLPKFWLRYLRA